jgi:acetylornithine deacetylase/succinyl-diaminopimelate desuccinylase-like protein
MESNHALAGLGEFVQVSEGWFREHLEELVEHRTVSPGATDDRAIREGANAAREIFRAAGATAELVETSGTPAVFAQFKHPKAQAKVLVYNHLDVQPAEGPGWTQRDPFDFEVEPHPTRGFLYRGRGTTDDKGPGLCALRAASWVLDEGLPIDIAFLWETEEEIGSPHFAEVIAARRDLLACDCVIVSDTIWPTATQPAVSAGLRGSLHAILKLRTGAKEVHSGLTGGVARNAVRELCALAAAIDGASFWKAGVVEPTAAEVESYTRAGFDVDYYMRSFDLERVQTRVPLEMMLRLWTRPTFEVHGLVGGYTGAGTKTIVPPQGELKISFRLVPEQSTQAVAASLVAFVREFNPDVEVTIGGALDPYRASIEGPYHDAIVGALHTTTGCKPVTVREGGSIGAVPVLARELGAPVHFLPLSLPDHGYHAPNEYFDWKQAQVGIAAFARTFATLAG